MSGHTVTLYDPTPAKCYPAKPFDECCRCGRFSFGEPKEGKTVAIDASTVRRNPCPMWIRRTQ